MDIAKENKPAYHPAFHHKSSISRSTRRHSWLSQATLNSTIEQDPQLSFTDIESIEQDIISIAKRLSNTLHDALPRDYAQLSLMEKLVHTKDQVRTICKLFPLNRMSYLDDSEINTESASMSLNDPIVRQSWQSKIDMAYTKVKGGAQTDLLTRVFNVGTGITLTSDEKNDLARLLAGAMRDSASDELQGKLSQLQSKYENLDWRLSEARKECRSLRNKHDETVDERDALNWDNQVLQKQVEALEIQLENSFAEMFMYEDLASGLKSELMDARRVIQSIPGDHEDANEYIRKLGTKCRNTNLSTFRESARLSITNGSFAFFGNKSMEFVLNSLSIKPREILGEWQELSVES